MAWQINVSHESGDRTRLIIEANPEVPEMVISVVAGAYWEEEVEYVEGWDELEEFAEYDEGDRGPGGLHG